MDPEAVARLDDLGSGAKDRALKPPEIPPVARGGLHLGSQHRREVPEHLSGLGRGVPDPDELAGRRIAGND